MYATTIMDSSLAGAWHRALKFVLNSPEKLTFGGGKEIKTARDSQTTIILDENAVNEALNGITHHLDPFCTMNKLSAYKKEYEADYPYQNFDYTYRGRLEHGFKHDQIQILKTGLQKQLIEKQSSNRNIAVLFNPEIDNFSGKATPCWNEVLIRLLNDNAVSIHLTFRSHDLWGAWEGNMCSILDFLNRDVIQPCGCHIKYVHEVNYSLHIYEADTDAAQNVVKTPVIRRTNLIGRQERYEQITKA